MKGERNTIPPPVEALTQYGLTTAYINFFVEKQNDKYIYETEEIKPGEWSLCSIINAIVRNKYSQIQVEQLICNKLCDNENKEWIEFKQYREKAMKQAQVIFNYGTQQLGIT